MVVNSTPAGICQCGCGQPVYKDTHYRIPKFLKGHNRRKKRMDRTCPVCGKSFTRRFAEVTKTKSNCCSKPCRKIFLQTNADRKTAERFWAKVDKSGECWIWTGGIFPDRGYGAFSIHSKNRPAHRIAWELTYGPIPDGLYACHHCDNRICVRPDHLFLGTATDNNRDMIAKGRNKRHLAPYGKRITPEQVKAIREIFAQGDTNFAQLGRQFGLSETQAARVVRRQSWKNI